MYEVDKDSCTTLKQWLEDKHSMDYKTYRKKSKSRRENLKFEYYKDTGLIITSDGTHYDARSSYYGSSKGYGGLYGSSKNKVIRFIICLLIIIAVCGIIYNYLPWYWWFVLGVFVIDSCIACSLGDMVLLSYSIKRGILIIVTSIAIGILLEAINTVVWYLVNYSLWIFVLISIGVLGLNHLISYLISKFSL